MENTNNSHKAYKLNNLSSKEHKEFVDLMIFMAKDSEDTDLDRETVSKGLNIVLNNKDIGHYNMIKDENNNILGFNLVHYEYDIKTQTNYHWIGSLFVVKEHRRKGIFSNYILNINKNQVIEKSISNTITNTINEHNKFNNVIRLYMDIYNKNAEQAYYKNGFYIKKELNVFEEDSLVNLKLKDTQKIIYLEDSNKFTLDIATKVDYAYIEEFINKISEDTKYYILSIKKIIDCNFNSKEYCLKAHLEGIKTVLDNTNKGKILLIKEKNNKDVIGMIYVSYEPSDWRNNLIWWIYEGIINSKYFDDSSFSSNCTKDIISFNKIINSIIKLNNNNGGNCTRFILPNYNEDNYKNSRALKSHYLVFEKEVN